MTPGHAPWALYERAPATVLGFHGCDTDIGEAILSGKKRHLALSENDYDWLGSGIYFWEANPQRALEFAMEAKTNPKISRGRIQQPFVLGAIIDLHHCLNLMDSAALQEVAAAHEMLKSSSEAANTPLPRNMHGLRARRLDCAVIEALHTFRKTKGYPPYDSVRGMFVEGEELYSGAGFRRHDHIQLCLRNLKCILGYFRPIVD